MNGRQVGQTLRGDTRTVIPRFAGRTWPPLLAKRLLDYGSKVKIAPVHSDFRCETCSLSLMGMLVGASFCAGFANHGLTCLALLHDRLCNRRCVILLQ